MNTKKYVFKPYLQCFPDLFNKEKERISKHLGQDVIIEHVGSTAIPGLGGKGIIDIALGSDRTHFNFIKTHLQKLGYKYSLTGSTEDRLFFKIDLLDSEQDRRTYHVHLTYTQSQDWKNLITFRNYLLTHECALKEYAQLKERAAQMALGDGAKYRDLKTPFLQKILSLS
jgi:GrpB-like predicted nucleotidyltransferase (UPF0157 family)